MLMYIYTGTTSLALLVRQNVFLYAEPYTIGIDTLNQGGLNGSFTSSEFVPILCSTIQYTLNFSVIDVK